jgi:hypothetical protein
MIEVSLNRKRKKTVQSVRALSVMSVERESVERESVRA